MESPDSDTSPDGESSLADSTSADPSPAQAQPSPREAQVVPGMETSTLIRNDDSASDVSMSTDSEDEDNDRLGTSSISATPTTQVVAPPTTLDIIKSEPAGEISKKRKYSDPSEAFNGHMDNVPLVEVHKRIKPEPEDNLQSQGTPDRLGSKDKSLLPPEIWHHIFTFCFPRDLGRLLQVNKTFNAYVDPSSSCRVHEPLSSSDVHILTPDEMWKASRHLHLQGMPTPLSGKSELDTWKLACGSLCQFCGKKRQTNNTAPVDQWHPGPGENGVIPVWPFGIRACGSCIYNQSTKEIDLLLSSSIPSPLMAALPFVFLTNELHVIPAATLQNGAPSGIQISKHFYNCHIEEIKQEFEEVKAMGSAAAEEWLKGLDGRGKERRNDSLRWERWQAGGGIARMSNLETGGIQIPQRQSDTQSLHSASTTPAPKLNGYIPTYQGHNSIHHVKPVQPSQPTQHPLTLHTGFVTNPPPRFDSPSQNGFGSYPPRTQLRHERTKEEVVELKAARRAEIERRCLLLNPPITSGVLAHMASFQAAIQIIQPLDDGAWEVLKPRLLSQRTEAEQRENVRIAQTRVVQERFDERRFQDMQAKSDSKDLVDREWDDIQGPLRARIGGYADETIRDGWNGGEKVSHDTAPQFAAEVLIYVRKRFYAEVAKDEAAIRATGKEPEMDPPNGPYTRRLVLENMKWVFDSKIKPHTEPYRKELFLCNACEFTSKYYGFEGVIQHYAAKHTSALSVGSVVVHWKSEWPENPPFHPDPTNANVVPYYAAAPSSSVPYAGSGTSMQQNFGYGGYQPTPVSAALSAPNPHVYQESPGPCYGHPQFGEQYPGHQNGPYAPPTAYPDTSPGYQGPQYTVAPPPVPLPGYNDPPQDYSQQNFGGQYQAAAQNLYTSPHASTLYPATVPDIQAQQSTYAPPVSQFGQSYDQQPSYTPNNFPQGSQRPQKTEEYKTHLQQIARDARDIWNSIGNLKEKDVPGALKVYTVIFHVLRRFRATFNADFPLAMLVDGLSNNKDMRPVRNVNGLVCKACSLGTSAPQKKRFSFPQLVNHFNAVHEQGLSSDPHWQLPDWTKDMVDLPDLSDLRLTSASPGMEDNKLKLFKEALPELFAIPPPTMTATSDMRKGSSSLRFENFSDQNAYQDLKPQDWVPPSLDNHEKYYATVDSGRPSEAGSVTYESGEYDPRHPGNLAVEPRQRKAQHRTHHVRGRDIPRDNQPPYGYNPPDEESERRVFEALPERSYIEHRPMSQPSQALPLAEYERVVVRDEPPLYRDRPFRYRDPEVEYRVRHEPRVLTYDDPEPILLPKDYRPSNSQAYRSNIQDLPPVLPHEQRPKSNRVQPEEDAAAQQNRIFEVVAQISQQAQQVRERQPIKEEAGSEDGEVRADPEPRHINAGMTPSEEASTAAERFLNNFLPGDTTNEAAKKKEDTERRREEESRARWEAERGERVVYEAPEELQRRMRPEYDEDRQVVTSGGRPIEPVFEEMGQDGYIVRERVPAQRQSRTYAYEDLYGNAIPEAVARERSPELVDRRYKLNNVVYRDERQDSHGTRRTPSRYARYESVRLENDRVRSRSPVYVKMSAPTTQYRERTPTAPAPRQDPIYRTRTPPPTAEEVAYERAPRQEYYRVYADEPRPREPQYAEAFEYVRVSDPQGDYMIRRPVRREPGPIYAYEDEVYARQPVYEIRAPTSRPEATVYEEYDPRHPAPPSQAPVRQVRYQ